MGVACKPNVAFMYDTGNLKMLAPLQPVNSYKNTFHMDVSKTRGTPKWMVYNGKPYEQMDDLGVPIFLETPI